MNDKLAPPDAQAAAANVHSDARSPAGASEEPRYYCKKCHCPDCGNTFAASPGGAGKEHVPAVLFDGYAVLSAMDERARRRTSTENISDVLDAVVRLLRGPALDEAGRVSPEPSEQQAEAERIGSEIDIPRLKAGLRTLSKAFVDGRQGSYGMHIPAEPYRDGDLVCGTAARLIERLEYERDVWRSKCEMLGKSPGEPRDKA